MPIFTNIVYRILYNNICLILCILYLFLMYCISRGCIGYISSEYALVLFYLSPLIIPLFIGYQFAVYVTSLLRRLSRRTAK